MLPGQGAILQGSESQFEGFMMWELILEKKLANSSSQSCFCVLRISVFVSIITMYSESKEYYGYSLYFSFILELVMA